MANNTSLNTNTVPVSPASGGTGVANTGTISVGGNTSFSGAFSFTGNVTGNTNITFPTSGTLQTTSGSSGVVNSGTANQIGYYASTGTAISGLTGANNSILATNGSGVPSMTGTLPFTVPVSTGGTGVSTMTTPYAPICAGTTATGALQVASAGIGVPTNVLTSNGSSAVPSFQPIPSTFVNTISTTLTGSQFQTMFTSPVQIIGPPVAGNMIIVMSLELMYIYGSAPFTVGSATAINLFYGSSGTATTGSIAPALFANTQSSMFRAVGVALNGIPKATFDGVGLFLSNATANFSSAGTGNSVGVIVSYIVVPTQL